MSVRCIIVDDESRSREALLQKLKSACPQVSVVAQCASAKEGIAAIRELKPELVFLDIEMPVMNGFSMLEALAPVNFEVIFTTAYDQYAIRAFRISALDYLLKPVNVDELKSAVANYEARAAVRQQKQIGSQLDLLLQNFRTSQSGPTKIALPTSEGFQLVYPSQVVRVQSDSNYCEFYFRDGKKLVVSRTLKEYEEMLEEYNFCRVHNSHLVNFQYVSKYIKGEGGYLVLEDGTSIEVSTRRKAAVMQRLGKRA